MRTVEQIAADLKKAEEEVQRVAAIRDKYRLEMQEVYEAAKTALGIKGPFDMQALR